MNRPADCYHCGEPVPDGPPIVAHIRDADHPMCCIGCKSVAEFIDASGLDAFYSYREQPDTDLNLTPGDADWTRFDSDDLVNRYVHSDDGRSEATIDVGGMYCSACVWLLDKALKRVNGIEAIDVNPATRRAVIRWDTDSLTLGELLAAISRIGFKPAPVAAGAFADTRDDDYRNALKRLIVAAAAGMQVMMFAVALYAGDYFGIEGDIEKFLRTISLLVTLPIVFFSARPFFAGAWRGLVARAPGMDLPVSIAIATAFLASTRATWTDTGDIYFDSVAMFVFFLSATRFLEMRARHRSVDHTIALNALLPDTAIRIVDGVTETVLTDQLREGDIVSIRPGDVLPADGEIVNSELSVDESMLTGESLPVRRVAGDRVFAGALVRQGNAMLKVMRTGASTSLAEIGRMLERAKADRPPIAIFADRIAAWFAVGVLLVTAIAAAAWTAIDPSRTFEVALATLVVTCPCALALATPAAIAAATASLTRCGFLLARSRILEVFNQAKTIIFDKTGTLTEGRPVVLRMQLLSESMPDDVEPGAIAAAIESASEHVLARAFSAMLEPGRFRLDDVLALPGAGVEATIDGRRYRIGRADYVAALSGADVDHADGDGNTSVFLGDEQHLLAVFQVGDELRSDAKASISALRSAGYRTVIVSGDRQPAVARIAERLGVDEWHAAMTPADKLAFVGASHDRGERVIMVGDGINDAPVLAAADASVALDAGTALARASADAVSLGSKLGALVQAAGIAKFTRRIIRQNIAWAIVYNLTAVPLAVTGMLAPWMAAIGMSASSLVVVLNALRLHRIPVTGDAASVPARMVDAEPETA